MSLGKVIIPVSKAKSFWTTLKFKNFIEYINILSYNNLI